MYRYRHGSGRLRHSEVPHVAMSRLKIRLGWPVPSRLEVQKFYPPVTMQTAVEARHGGTRKGSLNTPFMDCVSLAALMKGLLLCGWYQSLFPFKAFDPPPKKRGVVPNASLKPRPTACLSSWKKNCKTAPYILFFKARITQPPPPEKKKKVTCLVAYSSYYGGAF